MGYKIIATGFVFEGNTKKQTISLKKISFPFFWKRHKMGQKVYFDVYDKQGESKLFDGYATIDKDWIDLGYKDRNKITSLITKHFESDYTIGNWRNTLKKV